MSMSEVEAAPRVATGPQYARWLRQRRRERTLVLIARVLLFAVLLVLWEVLPRTQWVNPMLTSYPSAILPAFIRLLQPTAASPGILTHIRATLVATVIGFSAAMLLGTLIAGALWWWRTLSRVVEPYLVVANAIPKTALVPLFYIWLGAALSVYGMSLAISLFVTIIMALNAFDAADPNKIKLARTFGATKGQVLRKVVLPGSLPAMIATLKVTAGLSLVGVVVGEFQSANLGLGFLIQYGSQVYQMNVVMAAVCMLAVISSLMYLAIAWLEAAVARRRGTDEPTPPA
jgi:NitT/TauT family transport system permease protein